MRMPLGAFLILVSWMPPPASAEPSEFEVVLTNHLSHSKMDDCLSHLNAIVRDGYPGDGVAAWEVVTRLSKRYGSDPSKLAIIAKVAVISFLGAGVSRVATSADTYRIQLSSLHFAIKTVNDPQIGPLEAWGILTFLRDSPTAMTLLTRKQMELLCIIALQWPASRDRQMSIPQGVYRIALAKTPELLPETGTLLEGIGLLSERLREFSEEVRELADRGPHDAPSRPGARSETLRPRRVVH